MKEEWTVNFSRAAAKQRNKLADSVQFSIEALVKDMTINGPHRTNWPNYSPLKKGKDIPKDAFHCHVKKGKPTYVVCWQVDNKKIKIIEVFYAGTHEGAPY